MRTGIRIRMPASGWVHALLLAEIAESTWLGRLRMNDAL